MLLFPILKHLLLLFDQVQLTGMFNFPFYNIVSASDPFDNHLPQYYDVSYPFVPLQSIAPPLDAPKIEEKTSPTYPFQGIPIEPPRFELIEKIEIPSKQKKVRVKGDKTDDDYKPYKRGKASKGIVKQKQDRNLIPNTVHHLLAFVQKQFKSLYLVQQIFKSINHNPDYTITRFYNYHKILRGKINNYVNEEAMKIVTEIGSLDFHQYGEEQQTFYCLVSRILIKKFLKTEAILMILLSRKVKKDNILDHLSVQRYLFQNMIAEDRP